MRPLVADVDMCGVSTAEFALLLVIAIIVMGPERLPEALRGLGRLARQLRGMTGELGKVQDDIRNEFRKSVPIDDIKKKIQADVGVQKMRESHKEIESEIDAIRARIKSSKPTGLIANDATPERSLEEPERALEEEPKSPGPSGQTSDDATPGRPLKSAPKVAGDLENPAPPTPDPLRHRTRSFAEGSNAAGPSKAQSARPPLPKPISERNTAAATRPPTPFERAHAPQIKRPAPAAITPPTSPTTDDGDESAT